MTASQRSLYSAAEVATMIERGEALALAGSAEALAALPRGDWIGGTSPYFMTAEAGGVEDREHIFVGQLPLGTTIAWQGLLDADALPRFPDGGPDNGYTIILLPSQSEVHRLFATDGANWPGLFDRPVVGWVTGSALDRIGIDAPQVFDGRSGTASIDRACVMHVALPQGSYAAVDIVNLFEQGDGDVLTFDRPGFSTRDVRVNGRSTALVDYFRTAGIDTRLPLVADYNGAQVNVATAQVDADEGVVTFFAPVFPGIEYRVARPVADYAAQFAQQMETGAQAPVFSCNCVLNYAYAELEGKRTGSIVGPMTFGEIAYVLLTQTMVRLTVERD